MYIIGIDPGSGQEGSTTGVSILKIDAESDTVTLQSTRAIEGGLDGFIDAVLFSPMVAGLWTEDTTIVVEDFVPLLGVPVNDYTPAKIVGAIKVMFYGHTVIQPPAGRKSAVSDAVLKRLGVWSEENTGHHDDVNEATRHAIWYLKNQRNKTILRKGWTNDDN